MGNGKKKTRVGVPEAGTRVTRFIQVIYGCYASWSSQLKVETKTRRRPVRWRDDRRSRRSSSGSSSSVFRRDCWPGRNPHPGGCGRAVFHGDSQFACVRSVRSLLVFWSLLLSSPPAAVFNPRFTCFCCRWMVGCRAVVVERCERWSAEPAVENEKSEDKISGDPDHLGVGTICALTPVTEKFVSVRMYWIKKNENIRRFIFIFFFFLTMNASVYTDDRRICVYKTKNTCVLR